MQQLHKEIRTTSYLLHPPLLDERGLASALAWYRQALSDRSGLNIDLKISENFGRVSRDIELVVFRLVQECLTNIHRHSGAKNAVIRVARRDGNLSGEVSDDVAEACQRKSSSKFSWEVPAWALEACASACFSSMAR